MNTSTKPIASDIDLFRLCREIYPERIARVASVALFWSQWAKHELRGRIGIYKTDADLADQIGRRPKTCGVNLIEVCTTSEEPAALFQVAYGPKAGQHAGHCRWLFLTPRGEQIIEAAKKSASGARAGKTRTTNAPRKEIGT